jgi:pimeloyl-ACP methyl ester carboxylesterase
VNVVPAGSSRLSAEVAAWESRGAYRNLGEHRVFSVDIPAAQEKRLEPLLILHGFPTCSFDFHLVVDELARDRRLLLLDMLGYGFSSKPDLRYSVETQADVVEQFVAAALAPTVDNRQGRDAPVNPRISLLTHDMGDTVGGELLARQMEGSWPVEISRRVLTNGSIYIEMARLTDGQQFLLSLPDERLSTPLDPTGRTMTDALAATLSPSSHVPRTEVESASALIAREGGDTLLPRLIRYIEDRRSKQDRYTGAIESHPSPLGIVWGTEDPIAVYDMATKIAEARTDALLLPLQGVGHYPMIEAPGLFAASVRKALGE